MVKNRVVFLTGGARGIGYGIGKVFLENGARVVFTDMNKEKLLEGVENLQANGYDCLAVKCDVTSEDDIISAVQETIKKYGKIDILINNAGLQYVANIEDFPTEKYEQLIRVMQIAPFLTIKHILPIMKKQKYGRILNMASINGLVGFAGKSAYNSAKHGVIGLTKVAALEAAEYGITVNALCPGYVDTPLVRGQLEDLAKTRKVPLEKVLEEVINPLVPQKRLLSVQEIANYALFLVSEKTGGVTGAAAVIDGGYMAQ